MRPAMPRARINEATQRIKRAEAKHKKHRASNPGFAADLAEEATLERQRRRGIRRDSEKYGCQ